MNEITVRLIERLSQLDENRKEARIKYLNNEISAIEFNRICLQIGKLQKEFEYILTGEII